ncbi:YqaJ viral recombinase family protein [Microbacterium resistens]|uniref:YqaJ viral recombinase family protein n=1 Tax=Microbacterium resistens TaxID=156977 RepID=A0ABY3RQM5_9MICO|nr:YqaJ viral recombinase family protein [Microbacterium resistens]UGS26364.1 YqaJ viral recombinase family protein [Microbacterium resistens]
MTPAIVRHGFHVINDGTDRASWLADRLLGVSATDAARIMTGGAGTWATLRKEKESGRGFGGNDYTRHGREREAAIAAWAQHEFGLIPSTALVGRADGEHLAGYDDDRPFSFDLATPDALDVDPDDGRCHQIGEFKTTVKDWPTWGDVPRRYFWQVVWQLHVTGADRCRFVFEAHEDFVPLHMVPRVFTVERADVLDDIEEAKAQVAAWRAFDGEAVPEGLEALDALLSRREAAKEAAAAAADRVAAVEAEMRTLLVDYGKPVKFAGTGSNVTWTGMPVKTDRFDSAAFKKADPDTYARFIKTTESQPRLTITARS